MRLTVNSDGLSLRGGKTRVLLDDKDITDALYSLELSGGVDEANRVILKLHVKGIDIDVPALVALEAKMAGEEYDSPTARAIRDEDSS